MKNQNSNIACRIFAEQIRMLQSLPNQDDAKNILYQAVIHSLNQFENQIEMALRTGTLTYDQYYQLDRTLDQLDHRLDMAKDSLEYRLGVDD